MNNQLQISQERLAYIIGLTIVSAAILWIGAMSFPDQVARWFSLEKSKPAPPAQTIAEPAPSPSSEFLSRDEAEKTAIPSPTIMLTSEPAARPSPTLPANLPLRPTELINRTSSKVFDWIGLGKPNDVSQYSQGQWWHYSWDPRPPFPRINSRPSSDYHFIEFRFPKSQSQLKVDAIKYEFCVTWEYYLSYEPPYLAKDFLREQILSKNPSEWEKVLLSKKRDGRWLVTGLLSVPVEGETHKIGFFLLAPSEAGSEEFDPATGETNYSLTDAFWNNQEWHDYRVVHYVENDTLFRF